MGKGAGVVWTVPYGKIAGTNLEKVMISKTSG
jgi:hypothetical protein